MAVATGMVVAAGVTAAAGAYSANRQASAQKKAAKAANQPQHFENATKREPYERTYHAIGQILDRSNQLYQQYDQKFRQGKDRPPKPVQVHYSGPSGASSGTRSLVQDIIDKARGGSQFLDQAKGYTGRLLSGDVSHNPFLQRALDSGKGPSAGRQALDRFSSQGFRSPGLSSSQFTPGTAPLYNSYIDTILGKSAFREDEYRNKPRKY